jgi:hypothetical protein
MPEFNEQLSPEPSEPYLAATRIIEDGIAKSKEGGYADLKVEFWIPDDSQEGGHETRMSLSQFFGGNSLRHMVSKEEWDALFAKYGQESANHEMTTRVHKLGSVAAGEHAPVFESGGRQYRDAQSAAAGDYLDDDE